MTRSRQHSSLTVLPQTEAGLLYMPDIFSVNYIIKVMLRIAIRFSMNNDYCTTPHKQELIKDGLVLRPASFRDWGKNYAEGKRGPGL